MSPVPRWFYVALCTSAALLLSGCTGTSNQFAATPSLGSPAPPATELPPSLQMDETPAEISVAAPRHASLDETIPAAKKTLPPTATKASTRVAHASGKTAISKSVAAAKSAQKKTAVKTSKATTAQKKQATQAG